MERPLKALCNSDARRDVYRIVIQTDSTFVDNLYEFVFGEQVLSSPFRRNWWNGFLDGKFSGQF